MDNGREIPEQPRIPGIGGGQFRVVLLLRQMLGTHVAVEECLAGAPMTSQPRTVRYLVKKGVLRDAVELQWTLEVVDGDFAAASCVLPAVLTKCLEGLDKVGLRATLSA